VIKDIITRMPYDRIGVEKVRIEDEEKFIVVFMDSQMGKDFMSTSEPLSREEAAGKLRELEVPESEIQRLVAHAESKSV
jgi:hypothetical protein